MTDDSFHHSPSITILYQKETIIRPIALFCSKNSDKNSDEELLSLSDTIYSDMIHHVNSKMSSMSIGQRLTIQAIEETNRIRKVGITGLRVNKFNDHDRCIFISGNDAKGTCCFFEVLVFNLFQKSFGYSFNYRIIYLTKIWKKIF